MWEKFGGKMKKYTWPPADTKRLASASKAARIFSVSAAGMVPLYSTYGLENPLFV